MKTRGFTLVELVMVLVLVGILSVSALGLFASKSDFSSSLAKDQLIAAVHLAQQRALASHTDYPVLLTVSQTATEWRFRVSQQSDASTTLNFEEQIVEREGASLSITGKTFPATISFSQNGNLDPAADLTASFTGGTSHTVCITSAGFAFAAACP